MSLYTGLSDEDKLMQAIEFVAVNQPIPPELEVWLRDNGLYELITAPGLDNVDTRE